ncbi:MAG: alkaline phosphatase family protein [Candidatus Aminicenantes bacterium]|nr:alkaline phosphatase family protein [Candidatus Aminicenantes bacterium]
MALFKKQKRRRACVIGLDGVPHSLINKLAEDGIMPGMAGLLKSGHLHRMKASLPEISAVSWTDFMTGADSGSHGIFGFTDLKSGSYEMRFPNFSNVRQETIWDVLGKRGRRSIIINQPSTYPARPLDGILIAGFVALDLAKAVYPASQKAVLDRLGYRIDIDTMKSREDHAFLWQELQTTLDGREKALDQYWKEDWDYFEFVITGTDRLQHFLWNACEDPNHPFHDRFLDYYRRVDGIIGRIVDSFRRLTGGDAGLCLLSDHGFCQIEQEVYLNAWLQEKGYLGFTGESPGELREIGPGSRAFALDPNRIYLNLVDRFPKGAVALTDKPALKAKIAHELEGLKYAGRPVIRQVFDAEKIYSGPLVPLGPDLVVLAEPGFDLKGSVKKKNVFGRTDLEGMHTWDDAFFWADRTVGDDLRIHQLFALILSHFA